MDHDSKDTGKLWQMISAIRVAMMTTEDGNTLRARPMVAVDEAFDGTLWFFTRASSHKVTEVSRDSQVGLAYADHEREIYVSLSGEASLVRDAATIAAHWRESLKEWFPKGRDDPDVALLRVEVERGEYWDASSSTMAHLYGRVVAMVTGKPRDGGEHGTIGV